MLFELFDYPPQWIHTGNFQVSRDIPPTMSGGLFGVFVLFEESRRLLCPLPNAAFALEALSPLPPPSTVSPHPQHEHRTAPIIDLGALCVDTNVACRDWAAKGECENNRPFMVGKDVQPGACRESCNACPYPKLTGGGTAAPEPKAKVMTESIVRGGGGAETEERRRRRRLFRSRA